MLKKIITAKRLLKENPDQILAAFYSNITKLHITDVLSDKLHIKIFYRLSIGKTLNLVKPRSFNEKIQWMKLYDHKIQYTQLVDKYEVRKFVEKRLGKKYLIPCLGVWNSVEEIPFAELPVQFVLKCTHDSGSVIICKDKSSFCIKTAKKNLRKALKKNLYYYGREWAYKNVRPRIIAEEYLHDEEEEDLYDYKFMCFNGKVKCSFVCSNRFNSGLEVTFFDKEWNRLPFRRKYPSSVNDIKKPIKYDEMINIAEKLAEGLRFVRVDLYLVKNRIFFGEMTLYPGNGFEQFIPYEADLMLGNWLDIAQT